MDDYREYRIKSKVKKYFTIAFKIFFGIIAGIAFALLFGYVVMWLWNWLMPDVFGLTTINYWQAVGILVLAKMLFGGLGGNHSEKRKKKSRKYCKSTERRSSKNGFSKWKLYDKFWEEEGAQAYEEYVKRINDEKQ